MNKLAVIVLLIGLGACSSKKPEEGKEPAQGGNSGPVVGSAAGGAASAPSMGNAASPAAGSAAGAPSAAPGAAGDTARPAAPDSSGGSPAAVGCATATTLVCDAGQRDGCTGGLTAVHVCVAADAKAGAPCAQEVALKCPDGQVDACLRNPPLANHHVCVIVPKPPS